MIFVTGEQLTQWRKARGLTREETARLLRRRPNVYRDWELNAKTIPLAVHFSLTLLEESTGP